MQLLSTPRDQRAWFALNGSSPEAVAEAVQKADLASFKRVLQSASGAAPTLVVRGAVDGFPTLRDLGF